MASIDVPFRLRVVSDTEGRDTSYGDDLASLVARADRASLAGDRREAERLLAQAYVTYDGEARRGTLLRIADAAERLGVPNVAGELSFLANDDRSQGLRLAAHAVRRWEKMAGTGAHDPGNVAVLVRPVPSQPVALGPVPVRPVQLRPVQARPVPARPFLVKPVLPTPVPVHSVLVEPVPVDSVPVVSADVNPVRMDEPGLPAAPRRAAVRPGQKNPRSPAHVRPVVS